MLCCMHGDSYGCNNNLVINSEKHAPEENALEYLDILQKYEVSSFLSPEKLTPSTQASQATSNHHAHGGTVPAGAVDDQLANARFLEKMHQNVGGGKGVDRGSSSAIARWRAVISANTTAAAADTLTRHVTAAIARENVADSAAAAWDGPECGSVLADESVPVEARLQLLAQYDPGLIPTCRGLRSIFAPAIPWMHAMRSPNHAIVNPSSRSWRGGQIAREHPCPASVREAHAGRFRRLLPRLHPLRATRSSLPRASAP
jgi:hypothetical protein